MSDFENALVQFVCYSLKASLSFVQTFICKIRLRHLLNRMCRMWLMRLTANTIENPWKIPSSFGTRSSIGKQKKTKKKKKNEANERQIN